MHDQLAQASPDLMREMLSTFINGLLSAQADSVCGPQYGARDPERTNQRNGYLHRDFDTRVGARLIATLTGDGVAIDRIGVEGSAGLGAPVVAALRAAGYDVREIQASRTNDRRRRRHRATTDITDAQAIASETLVDPALPPAGKHANVPSQTWETLHVLRA